MNGLLTIYKKTDIATPELQKLLNKGLETLSHRGSFRFSSYTSDRDLLHAASSGMTGRLIAGACATEQKTPPVAFGDGDLLFFDGRLLNHAELCKTLSLEAARTNDPEIVRQLIRREGCDGFKRLKGYWSSIYIDAGNKVIYGARDHFGCKPLFFCNSNAQFSIASESRTLYALFDDIRSINRRTVTDYLLWGNIGRQDQYFFNDIHSIEPSHFVQYDLKSNRLTIGRYYTLPYNHSKESYRHDLEKTYTEKFSDLFAHSVQKNMQLTDGSLAIGVSGGMDSSSLICQAKKSDPQREIIAYTTTDNYDGGEACWAEKVIRHTGVEWKKVVCTSDNMLESLPKANRVHHIPLYNASSVAQYRMMEEISKQGQTVFMDGQGGDEMLGGYQDYFPLWLQSLRKNGEWRNWRHELSQVGNAGMSTKELVVRRLKLWAKAHYYYPEKLAQQKRKPLYDSLMPPEREQYFKSPSPLPEIKKEILNDALFESYTTFLGNILRWGEHSAASFGIECMMPFSDNPDLTEFTFSVPSSYKIRDGWNKYLQRKAMAGTVPDEIRWRKQKMGFYIPEQNWLNEMNRALFDGIRNMKDPEECIHQKYMTENWNRLYTPANLLFQRFSFRCYSYLLWRNGL
jgi:asparagine synthase (glutamine-hydrolysing)